MHRVYVAFEGGGARGVAHVGALKALQEAEVRGEIEICGYAGTSAGAVMASLAAAGFRWDELADPVNDRHILKLLFDREGSRLPGDSPVALLGAEGWRWINAVRGLMRLGTGGWSPVVLAPWVVAAVLLLVIQLGPLAWLVPPALIVLGLAVVGLVALWLLRLPGLAKLDNLEMVLGEAFNLALGRAPDAPPPRFSDMQGMRGGRRRMVPTIVTTDFSDGSLRYFPSRPSDLSEPLAPIVTASACIPLVFEPRSLSLTGEAVLNQEKILTLAYAGL